MIKKYLINIRILLVAAASVLIISGCQTSRNIQKTTDDPELLKFASVLVGSYSSKDQAMIDTNYFNISLVMTRIWEERTDAVWLYVEQALTSMMDKPYRQRVYKLEHPAKNKFTSEIFTIKNQQQIIGLQNDAGKPKFLTHDLIEMKEGCTVVLYLNKGVYSGGTEGSNCSSNLRGASYATTKITLKKGLLESWDQGFDSSGKQVWGPEKGAYKFEKL